MFSVLDSSLGKKRSQHTLCWLMSHSHQQKGLTLEERLFYPPPGNCSNRCERKHTRHHGSVLDCGLRELFFFFFFFKSRCKRGPRHRCCKHYNDNCISYCVKVSLPLPKKLVFVIPILCDVLIMLIHLHLK